MKKLLNGIVLSAVLVCVLTACGITESKPPETVGQIAYNAAPRYGYTVQVMEDGKQVPYLVLDNDYQGCTLLLRKDILTVMTYSREDGDYSNYYATSDVDKYLQQEYLSLFEDDFRDILCFADIGISCKFPDEDQLETISRKAFLLSASEVNFPRSLLYVETDKRLSYFKKEKDVIAYYEGEACCWYLRSAYLDNDALICAIGPDSKIGGGSVAYTAGVRPAICVPSDLPIQIVEEEDSVQYYIDSRKQ